MSWVLIVHEVADYDAWKVVFDDAAALRRDAGERSFQVLRDTAQPERVVHFSRWTSTTRAREFFESPELERIRAQAGVRSPEFVYLDEVDRGVLQNDPAGPARPPRMHLTHEPLVGPTVCLEPYASALRDELRATLDVDPEAWELFASSGAGPHFDVWWDVHTAPGWFGYAVRERSTGRLVGTSSFLNVDAARAVVEIGATFIAPEHRGSTVNPEAKLLMLDHAFACGARRVQLLTDRRNARSRAAIAKLGAVEEGVLRRDRVTWTGHVRDSVLFSITDLDWPAVRSGLRQRLGFRD